MPDREVVEALGPGLTRHWRLGAVHHEAKTPYQHVLIAETAHGTTLFCDDERQSAEATQLVYHEALFLPSALLAARRDRVLVVGSSEGVVSQQALAVGAQVVDHVDIDPDCVRACAEHLPYGYSPEELAAAERHDGPVRVHYGDGAAFVAAAAGRTDDTAAGRADDTAAGRADDTAAGRADDTAAGRAGDTVTDTATDTATQRYDVIVVDLPDERPDEPGAQLNRLYTVEFLRRCAGLLADGGVVVSQAGSPALWRNATLRAALDRFGEVFAQVVPYVSDEHEWAFLTGRQVSGPDPVGEMTARLEELSFRPVSLDAEALRARSVLPFALRQG